MRQQLVAISYFKNSPVDNRFLDLQQLARHVPIKISIVKKTLKFRDVRKSIG